MTTAQDQQSCALWIDPNDKSQKQFLPHIGEAVLFKHAGRVYTGKHTGGGFKADYPLGRMFTTWDCEWMYPAALDQAARALPARGVDPMLDTPVGMEPAAVVNDHYSRDGVNDEISAFLPVDTKLYTAAQVQAMGRVPPAGMDVVNFMDRAVLRMPYNMAMSSELARAQFYQRVQGVLDRIGVAAPWAPAAQANMGESHIAPPPAAQERKPLTDEQISDMRGADLGALNFVTLREFRAIARAVEAAHGIKDPAHGQQT